MFEKSSAGRRFTVLDRAGTFVKLGLEYSLGEPGAIQVCVCVFACVCDVSGQLVPGPLPPCRPLRASLCL